MVWDRVSDVVRVRVRVSSKVGVRVRVMVINISPYWNRVLHLLDCY